MCTVYRYYSAAAARSVIIYPGTLFRQGRVYLMLCLASALHIHLTFKGTGTFFILITTQVDLE